MSARSAPPSLRRTLALGLSGGLAVLWLLAMVGAGLVLRNELDEVFDSALQETAERILPLAVIELIDTETDRTAQSVSPIGPHSEFLTYVVRGRDGVILLHSHDANLADFATTGPEEGFHNTGTHRIFTRAAVSGTYRIAVAEPLEHRRSVIVETLVTLLAPLLLLLPSSLVLIAWITNRALTPISAMSHEVRARDGSDLSPLAAEGLQAELLPIRDAVNRLMEQLKRQIDAERSFTANAAHELRTPVAAALAQTQRLVAESPAGPLRKRALAIEAELKRLARLAEKLLQLARAEGAWAVPAEPQDMVPILRLVLDDFIRAGHGAGLHLTMPPEGAAFWRMDPDAFAILARNLVENALRYGAEAAPVEVVLNAGAGLCVTNAGPVLPAETLARLTTRFERASTLGQGSGLGLAIVDSLARGAGARLVLHSPAPGRDDGFSACVVPPPAPG